MTMCRKFGFTLAEVLITLAIIGIVAALTLPTLIQKYQMKVFATAFKKQYSAIQNVLDYLYLEEGLSNCYVYVKTSYLAVSSDCSAIHDGIAEKMKLTNSNINFTSLDYQTDSSKVIADGGKFINSGVNYYATTHALNKAFLSPDGSYIFFGHFSNPDAFQNAIIVIDINGKKGPNKWGYDLFFLTLSNRNNTGKIFLTDEYYSITEKGGVLPRTILQNKEKSEDSDYDWYWK